MLPGATVRQVQPSARLVGEVGGQPAERFDDSTWLDTEWHHISIAGRRDSGDASRRDAAGEESMQWKSVLADFPDAWQVSADEFIRVLEASFVLIRFRHHDRYWMGFIPLFRTNPPSCSMC